MEGFERIGNELRILKSSYAKREEMNRIIVEAVKRAFEDVESNPEVLRLVDDPKKAVRARLKAVAERLGRDLREVEDVAIRHVPIVRSVLGED